MNRWRRKSNEFELTITIVVCFHIACNIPSNNEPHEMLRPNTPKSINLVKSLHHFHAFYTWIRKLFPSRCGFFPCIFVIVAYGKSHTPNLTRLHRKFSMAYRFGCVQLQQDIGKGAREDSTIRRVKRAKSNRGKIKEKAMQVSDRE